MAHVLEPWLSAELNDLKLQGMYRKRPRLESGQGARVRLDGRDVIMLSSTNYLGLAEDPRVIEAAIRALREFGAGTAAGPRLCGVTSLHIQLEEELAEFLGTEAALVYTSAYMANLGLIATVARPEDIIFSDRLNHASIIDGCRFSRARIVVYPHNDMQALASLIAERRGEGRHAFIVTDGVFSMDADMVPLPQLVELARHHRAMTIVDDAHGTGVVGPTGRGTHEYYGLTVDALTGTLGKALGGGVGGFVAGSKDLIDYLIQESRSYRFTNTLPPASIASALEALRILKEEGPELLARLRNNGSFLRRTLAEGGFRLLGTDLPMVPILIGNDRLALQMSRRLLEEGVFVQAYTFPVVPRGTARVRCIVTAAHSQEDLEQAAEALLRVGEELGIRGEPAGEPEGSS